MRISKRIWVIFVALVVLACATVCVYAVGTTIHIISDDSNSAGIHCYLSFDPSGTTATASTSMSYGFCNLTVGVRCNYLDLNSAVVSSTNMVYSIDEDYSVSAVATSPHNYTAVGGYSYHYASSPDTTLSNSTTLTVGKQPT